MPRCDIEGLKSQIEQLKKENAQLHKFLEEFNTLDVAKENQQLKELLKECRNLINECISGDYIKELYERIDEVLK